jgi:hypothetical protein
LGPVRFTRAILRHCGTGRAVMAPCDT